MFNITMSLQNSKSRDCLFGLPNETLTPMGARLLKTNILQPPTEGGTITARQDAVAELSSNEEAFRFTRKGTQLYTENQLFVEAYIEGST